MSSPIAGEIISSCIAMQRDLSNPQSPPWAPGADEEAASNRHGAQPLPGGLFMTAPLTPLSAFAAEAPIAQGQMFISPFSPSASVSSNMFASSPSGAVGGLDFCQVPMQQPFVQSLPPAPLFAAQSSALPPLPNRLQLLNEGVALCSAIPTSRDEKMDHMFLMLGTMFKLMLLDTLSGRSSPLSPAQCFSSACSGTTTSSSSSDDMSSIAAACGSLQLAPKKEKAAAVFRCPACPQTASLLTEEGFYKHVKKWRILKDTADRSRKHRSSAHCPGIRSDHPLLTRFEGNEACRVDQLVSAVLSVMNPGSNAAHTAAGSGNHVRVQQLFETLSKPL